MPTYKLTYFDIRAKAELSRILFTYQGQDYEDIRITFDEWPKIKPTTPFGSLPTLTIDDKVYTESLAISNHLAREFGLYGKTGLEMLEVDQVLGKVQDIWKHIVDWIHAKGDAEKATCQKTNEETNFPVYLNAFEKILTNNGTGFYVGNKVTYADLAVFDALDIQFPESLLEKYPKVKANRDMVQNHDRLKDYLSNRKSSTM